MSVTLRDIARHTNVSVSTVSRALNDYQYVDIETRLLVQQAAVELGYPFTKLRSTSKLQRQVLLLTHHENPAEFETSRLDSYGIERLIVRGARRILEQCGLDTRIQNLTLVREHVDQYVEDPDVVGLILMGGIQNNDFVRALLDTDLPFVIAGSHARPLEVNCVMADYRYGVEQAIAHLALRGRTRIGLLKGPEITNTSEEKYLGFRLGLAMHNLVYAPEQVINGDFNPDAGYYFTNELLARKPDLDAIIYTDDYAAMGGLRALKQSGRRVPEDVAVVGFHDYEVANYTEPPLTTVQFDMHQMGVIAARRLAVILAEPTENAWLTLVSTRLIIREST